MIRINFFAIFSLPVNMDDDQERSAPDDPQGMPALFALVVYPAFDEHDVRIFENTSGCSKTESVFSLISAILGLIPLKSPHAPLYITYNTL